ncbi:MAG: hypothetical protein Q9171_000435 [Xanthocarpia ochracea]
MNSRHSLRREQLKTMNNPFSAFTYQAIDRILGEGQHIVGTGYHISTAILCYLQYLADALLLAAIFTYIIPRVASARQSTGDTRTYSAPLFLHILLCGLLVVLWLVMTIVGIVEVARQALGLAEEDPHSRRITVFVFDTLYLFAVLEILGLAVIAIWLSRRGNDRTSNKHHLPLVFLILVSVPLFVRQTWEFAFRIAYKLSTIGDLDLILPILLARQIFATLCTISVYAGLALVMKGLKRNTVLPYANDYAHGSPVDSGRRVGKGTLGPEIPIMRLAAPTEDQEAFDPHSPNNESRGEGVSREHS